VQVFIAILQLLHSGPQVGCEEKEKRKKEKKKKREEKARSFRSSRDLWGIL
jgi:hypothetical protein